ncbi:hypothetical protein [Nocardia higoensis]|uniref:hypothetical protein n=1 Tax=Nocardia higoensis TaxID=228599 RepID=UPI0012F6D12B|nr:hypothetical protein [Nocardia higoensis]
MKARLEQVGPEANVFDLGVGSEFAEQMAERKRLESVAKDRRDELKELADTVGGDYGKLTGNSAERAIERQRIIEELDEGSDADDVLADIQAAADSYFVEKNKVNLNSEGLGELGAQAKAEADGWQLIGKK